ncbi:MAG: hypothetical protein AAFX41_14780 [Bacteroidota bacterium]
MTPTEFAALALPILDHAREHGMETQLIPGGYCLANGGSWRFSCADPVDLLEIVTPDMIDAFVGRWVSYLGSEGCMIHRYDQSVKDVGGLWCVTRFNGDGKQVVGESLTTATARAVRVELGIEGPDWVTDPGNS